MGTVPLGAESRGADPRGAAHEREQRSLPGPGEPLSGEPNAASDPGRDSLGESLGLADRTSARPGGPGPWWPESG